MNITPPHRPFFSNFLAAFRAHGPSAAFQKSVSSTPSTLTTTSSAAPATLSTYTAAAQTVSQSASSTTTMSTAAAARAAATKTHNNHHPQTVATVPGPPGWEPSSTTMPSAQSASATATASLAIQTAHGTFQPTRHHAAPSPYSRSPSPSSSASPGSTTPIPFGSPYGSSPYGGGRRRGSDSSSEGFKDMLGQEKWYIGGRTASGEERFYQLGMVRRPRSVDRLSCDRMSL